jgi:hypothetical protein
MCPEHRHPSCQYSTGSSEAFGGKKRMLAVIAYVVLAILQAVGVINRNCHGKGLLGIDYDLARLFRDHVDRAENEQARDAREY